MNLIEELYQLILERREADPDKSYVAKLAAKGRKKMAEKVGEEATEVVIASLAEDKEDIIDESADLIFHLWVLLADCGVTPLEVGNELKRRMGQSGLDEKAARKSD